MSPTAHRRIVLALALASGPVAGAATQQLSYMLVPHACAEGRPLAQLAIATVTGAMCVVGLMTSRRLWRARHAAAQLGAAERFLTALAFLLSGTFLLIVIALTLPNVFVGPCG